MDRAEAIKFKLMRDGQIRGHDTRKSTGISEWHIATPFSVCDTVTVAHAPKILTADIYIYRSLIKACSSLK